MTKLALVLVSSLLAAACAEESAPPSGVPHEATVDPAVTLLARGGDFRFSLDESSVKGEVERRCAGATDCLADIRRAAAGEGIELLPLGAGRLRYVSYSIEQGERSVHLDAELRLEPAQEDGIVALSVERIAVGQAPPADARLLVEVVDSDTIAMDKQPGAHPRTGGKRLVFHRAPR